jgi:nucleoside-triphosphatase THEP1
LGVFISKLEEEITQVTIKIGHMGMNSIVQTFRRYGYNVVSQHQEDKFLEDLKARSAYLDRYLNM